MAIVLAAALMASQDALVKLMSEGLPLWQMGPTSAVAGLDFSYLESAAIWASLLLGTAPDR